MNRCMTSPAKAIFCAFVCLGALAGPSQAQIVALGASVVQGYGVNPGEAFPEQLAAMLRAKGKSYSVSNQGVFGDTTAGVLARLDSAVPEGTRIVILMIGGNDIRLGKTPEEARAGVRAIVARLEARKIRVILAMPYYMAARRRGMMVDRLHLNAEGQKYMAAQLARLIN